MIREYPNVVYEYVISLFCWAGYELLQFKEQNSPTSWRRDCQKSPQKAFIVVTSETLPKIGGQSFYTLAQNLRDISQAITSTRDRPERMPIIETVHHCRVQLQYVVVKNSSSLVRIFGKVRKETIAGSG
jgi:hypothetical protein